MKLKLGDILNNRYQEKHKIYCIETEKDLYVIYGSFIKKANHEINHLFYDFLNKKKEWRHIERNVIDYFDEFSEKYRINKETVFEVKSAYTSGEKII